MIPVLRWDPHWGDAPDPATKYGGMEPLVAKYNELVFQVDPKIYSGWDELMTAAVARYPRRTVLIVRGDVRISTDRLETIIPQLATDSYDLMILGYRGASCDKFTARQVTAGHAHYRCHHWPEVGACLLKTESVSDIYGPDLICPNFSKLVLTGHLHVRLVIDNLFSFVAGYHIPTTLHQHTQQCLPPQHHATADTKWHYLLLIIIVIAIVAFLVSRRLIRKV